MPPFKLFPKSFMNIKSSFDITVSETVINRLQRTKEAVEESFTSINDRAQHLGDDWKQTATQSTQNAIDTFTNTVEKTKGSLEQNLQPLAVQTVINSSLTDWFEQHPAFLRIIKSFNWSINHPIISLIILLFSLAIFWSLIKAIGRFIESASLSIAQIPLKLTQALIKYIWFSLGKFTNFATKKNKDAITPDNISQYNIQEHTNFKISSCSKQQRLKDISFRLEEIQKEQQELLQEAANLLNLEKINNW